MNFSATKQNGLTKKCVVRAFKVNTSSTNILFDQIASSSKFVVGAIVPVSSSKHIKLKEFSTSGNMHYLHFAMYNPKEQVSITPNFQHQTISWMSRTSIVCMRFYLSREILLHL